MTNRFLIIDGYSQAGRDAFAAAGMSLGSTLYGRMLHRWMPQAEYTVWLPSESPDPPEGLGPEDYLAILWTGSNLNAYDRENPTVARQLRFAAQTYQAGTPAFGSCWGLQVAVTAAGGSVSPNPRGREIGFARAIQLTPEGRNHPMLEGKPPVFDNFSSHLDEVTSLPSGARVLAGNQYSQIQAIEIRHKQGIFWGVQYHPEYDLHEMGRLITSRASHLIQEQFFQNPEDLAHYVEQLEALDREPDRKDLRWQLALDDTVISVDCRQLEFRNFIHNVVLPRAAGA